MPSHRNKGSSKGPSQRQLRVGEVIRKALADIFIKVDIRDETLSGIIFVVSEVTASPDIRNATAYISPMGGKISPEQAIEALNQHSKFLRGELARKVDLKYIPQITFALDTAFDNAQRIDDVLSSPKVAQDLKS